MHEKEHNCRDNENQKPYLFAFLNLYFIVYATAK